MRKVRPTIAIILVIVVLLVASGIVASLMKWSGQWSWASERTSNVNLLVVLVTLGTAAVSIGVVLLGQWRWRRPKHRREKASRIVTLKAPESTEEECSKCPK